MERDRHASSAPPGATPPSSESAGFTLIECVLAVAILLVLALGGAGLVARSVAAGGLAHARSASTALAAAKMEELRALTWRVDDRGGGVGLRVSDVDSDLTTTPPGRGGPGLRPSPVEAATRDTAGYVDYIDVQGRVLGAGDQPPPEAFYVRRWAVVPLASDPDDALVLIVIVSTVIDEARNPGDAWRAVRLVSLRSRSRS